MYFALQERLGRHEVVLVSGMLVDLIGEWIPDVAMRRKIMVDNPTLLCGF